MVTAGGPNLDRADKSKTPTKPAIKSVVDKGQNGKTWFWEQFLGLSSEISAVQCFIFR